MLHGTKADLAVGDLLVPGRRSNYGGGRTANHVYVTATLDAATWGAELAVGEGRGRIYLVEPSGSRGRSQRDRQEVPRQPDPVLPHREPVKVVGELEDWGATRPSSSRRCGRPRRPGAARPAVIYD